MGESVHAALKVNKTIEELLDFCEGWCKILDSCKELFRKLHLVVDELNLADEHFEDLLASTIESLRDRHRYALKLSMGRELKRLRNKTNDLENLTKSISKKRSDFMSIVKSQTNLNVAIPYDNKPCIAKVLDLLSDCQATFDEEVSLRRILMMEFSFERDEVDRVAALWLDDSSIFELQERLKDLQCEFNED